MSGLIKMKAIFPTSYFPSISYMAAFLHEAEAEIEQFETYPKQTYRNRCVIMSANGLQVMSVPVSKVFGNHTMTKDMVISYQTPWQQIYQRSLESAYKASPYFDYYFPYIENLFRTKTETLIELNQTALKTILKLLNNNKEIYYTTDYQVVSSEIKDYREIFHPKKTFEKSLFSTYYQVFSDRFSFEADLSILDLLFNEGPMAMQYLKKLQEHHFDL